MGYLQGSGQDGNMRWKTVSNQDEGDYQSPALGRLHASKSANSGLSMRRQPVYPPSDVPSTAGSSSLPVHRKAASDTFTMSNDAKIFGHLRSSMGRLSLHNNRGMAGKTPLGVLHESTSPELLDDDEESSDQMSDHATGSALLLEAHSPLSIRNHIKAQLKTTDQDRNGMRISRLQETGPNDTSNATNRRTTRRGYSNQCLPADPLEMESEGKVPGHGNITTSFQYRKRIQEGTMTTSRPPGRDSHMYPPDPRIHNPRKAIRPFGGHNSAARPGMENPARTGDTGILRKVTEVERPYANFERNGSVLKPETDPPFRLDRVMAPRRFGKDVVTKSVNGQIPLPYSGDERPTTHKDRKTSEQKWVEWESPWVGWESPFTPKFDSSFTPLGASMPMVQLSQSRWRNLSLQPAASPPVLMRPPPATPAPPPAPPVLHVPLPPPSSPELPSPMMHMDSGQPPKKSRTIIKSGRPKDRDEKYRASLELDARHMENKKYRAQMEFAASYMQKIRNKRKGDSPGHRTNDISSTISKDNSADESVRNAKLLADMGERSQRSRSGNDTELRELKEPKIEEVRGL